MSSEAEQGQVFACADSHNHIDMSSFDGDRAEAVARARAAGVLEFLIVGGVDAENGHRRAVAIAEELGVPVSAGVHPHEAKVATEETYDELRTLARAGRIKALGELGLDFHYDHSPRDVQREVFRRQVRLAREVELPVVIHTREADEETCDILEAERAKECGGVIHCFSGGHELARRALALGFYVSFSGIMTFPKAQTIQAVATEVPLDRLLIETDAPFLAPPPHRGKRNEPAFVVEVARKLAALRGTTPEEIGRASLENFRRLFRTAR